jgi:hypothetical protein
MNDSLKLPDIERELPADCLFAESAVCPAVSMAIREVGDMAGHARFVLAKAFAPYVEHGDVGRTIPIEVWVFIRL